MSNFCQSNGDDYPEAALKHLNDARALLNANRYDGTGYHAGYIIECAFKTLLQLESRLTLKHNLNDLSHQVAILATGGAPSTARYIPTPPSTILYATPPSGWKETMRYRAEGDLDQIRAQDWVREAERIYGQSVQKMRMDGVIQ